MKNIICFLVVLGTSLLPHSLLATEEFISPLASVEFKYNEQELPVWIEKSKRTHQERVIDAFENVSAKGHRQALCPLVANLYLGKDIEATNKKLILALTSKDKQTREHYRLDDHWCLIVNQQLYWMYYAFGSNGRIAKGRLYPQTQKALLELLWERMKYKNDIHLARQSTWWMTGSENHDIVWKVSNLISSRIFMNEPEYASRIYPDIGKGGGSGYWFHQMYGGADDLGPEGRGSFKDGKEYNAEDHYNAWVKFFEEYLRERAKKGFFLEVASPGYMSVTISHLIDIYELSGDEELKELSGKFLDLVWAEWVQDQLNGVRGGAKTRASDGNHWRDAMYKLADFYFGGRGSARGNYFVQLLSDYKLKPLIWKLALDRQSLGEFAYISRKPGEEKNRWPRPLGTERTLLCDTESRFVRYSWVTPDYILGCQMDHPGAIHSHLSVNCRWQGIIFKGSGGPRVYPCDIKVDEKGDWKEGTDGYCRCVQDKNVMIAQQCRRWMQMNPDWFPARPPYELPFGIYFGNNHDKVVEQKGWIFVEDGDAYLAVRVLMGEYPNNSWQILKDIATAGRYSEVVEDSYDWNKNRTMIKLKDKYNGMIFEAARRKQYPTLEMFIADVLDNDLMLEKTVVPGWHILRYKGCGDGAKEIYFNLANSEIPTIGGRRVDYSPAMVFDSPYLKSEYESGVVTIQLGNEKSVLDFN